MTGTHTGEALGVPPTGEPLLVHGISLATVRRGKIVEHWVYSDAGGTSLPGYRPD